MYQGPLAQAAGIYPADAERVVRVEFANGAVSYFEGEKGEERMVRAWLLDDAVSYYEGETNAERRVRRESVRQGGVF